MIDQPNRWAASNSPSEMPTSVARELEWLAHWMDSVFRIPGVGIRFGLDSLLGLLPGFGDTATSIVSLYILNAATRHGVSRSTLIRMALNIAADYTLGAIPILGDLFDVYWKSNQRNLALLKRHALAAPLESQQLRRGDQLFVAGLIVGLVLLLIGSVTATYFLLAWLSRFIFQASS